MFIASKETQKVAQQKGWTMLNKTFRSASVAEGKQVVVNPDLRLVIKTN